MGAAERRAGAAGWVGVKVACLGSGSRGNAFAVEARGVTALVDCGFSPAGMRRRLAALNLSPGEVDFILITHEHRDHSRGLEALAAESGAEAVMTFGTAAALGYSGKWRPVAAGTSVALRGVRAEAFAVCHDAAEPAQFVLDDGARRLAIVTDLGRLTDETLSACENLDGLVVECNYDAEMLRDNRRYPLRVKERICGGMGHLENGEAAALARAADGGRLRFLAAAHLSENNNRPELARAALAQAMNGNARDIAVADQAGGFGWRTI